MADCIFCKIINGELPGEFLYKDDDVIVFKDIHPQAPVHLLVVSKKHVPEFIAADEKLIASMTRMVKKVIGDQKLTGYRIVNNGKDVALVDHLHIHVLGRIDKYRKL